MKTEGSYIDNLPKNKNVDLLNNKKSSEELSSNIDNNRLNIYHQLHFVEPTLRSVDNVLKPVKNETLNCILQ
jgi:hypothetical protein